MSVRLGVLYCFVGAVLISSTLYPYDESKGEERTEYVEAGVLLKCRVVLPEGYDKDKKYPLVVGLHGRYADADYAVSVWQMIGLEGFIFAAPQGPYPEGAPGKWSWGKSDPEVKGLWSRSKERSEHYITKATRHVIEMYSVDPMHVYLAGHSQGAAMAYNTGIKHHSLYDGLLVFSGWLNEEWVPAEKIREAKGLKAFIAHGRDDDNVKHNRAVEAKRTLEKHGYDVTFFDFKGGHAMSKGAAQAAAKWLKKQAAIDKERD